MALHSELKFRRDNIRVQMAEQGIDAALIACNTNLFYTCGQIISGYCYIPLHSPAILFIKRPNTVAGEHVEYVRKPEQIVELLQMRGLPAPTKLMLEGDELPFTEYVRLSQLWPEAEVVNGTPLIRQARMTKTDFELNLFRRAGMMHAKAYKRIPEIYIPGMTDHEFSIEMERVMRQEGSLGIFRIFGRSMEIFMGSILAGDNAEEPSPYDFALGGAGLNSALPVGTSGTRLTPGTSMMVDLGGNFNGYMSDMSRVYSIGKLPQKAYDAHKACIEVQNEIAEMAKPGAAVSDLYDKAMSIMDKAGFVDNFMGTRQKAQFIGHGVGLEINEMPVIAPRQKVELEPRQVFALEPKIVLPGIGPVGVENTWIVTEEGLECTTKMEEDIMELPE